MKKKKCDRLIIFLLPETEEGVKEIAKIMGIAPKPPHVLLGINASETRLRKVDLSKYKYIHFATHGCLKFNGIKEPFLILGQVENTKGDDGFLTFKEVMKMKLNADLVTLSASYRWRKSG